jgi:hypothetical protein
MAQIVTRKAPINISSRFTEQIPIRIYVGSSVP